jgi:hypothetical protein
MLTPITRLFRKLVEPAPSPRIHLDGDLPSVERIVIGITLGDIRCRSIPADATLGDALSPERLRRIVRFCTRRRLPVDAWVISGVWHLPGRVDEAARWLSLLGRDAGEAAVWIDAEQMPARYRRRLRAHLLGLGCQIL